MQVTIYKTERDGKYRIVAPFKACKVNSNPRKWTIYGRREGVSAVVLCRAVNADWPTRRDANAFLATMNNPRPVSAPLAMLRAITARNVAQGGAIYEQKD